MTIQKVTNPSEISHLFKDSNDSFIWSYLQGVMGEGYSDKNNLPVSAKINLGNFCFLAGKINKELLLYKSGSYKENYIMIVPPNKNWENTIVEVYKDNAKKRTRYALKKHTNFNIENLQNIILKLPEKYDIKKINKELYNQILTLNWAKDMCIHFKDYNDFNKNGIGYVITSENKIISGASSYSYYKGGIEVEIDTDKDYRRQGLASIIGAKLILECFKLNLYPSWDADNLGSLELAKKLGYELEKEYTIYEISEY